MTASPLSAPILASAVAREIKATGSLIWLIQKAEFGLVFRCERGSSQFRIVLSPLAGTPAEVPPEGKNPTHVVTSITNLRTWLQSLVHS